MSDKQEQANSEVSYDSDISELNVVKDMTKQAHVIKNHFNPDTYHEKADLLVKELKI